MYKSLVAQTLHYFSRPHEAIRREPIQSKAAWRGADLASSREWRVVLDESAVLEIERALARARDSKLPLGRLTARDFPLPRLSPAESHQQDDAGEAPGTDQSAANARRDMKPPWP